SHSLVTSQLITHPLSLFLQEYEQLVDFRLHLWTELVFPRVVGGLMGQEIDLALVWGVQQRLRGFSEVRHELIGPEFEVVVISHDAKCIDRLPKWSKGNVDLGALAQAKVLTLGRANQPAFELLPRPNRTAGGRHIELGTIDAIVACVRA